MRSEMMEASNKVVSKRRKLMLQSALAVASLIAALLLVELAVRLFVDVTDLPVYFWDPVLGPRRAPRQSGRYLVAGGVRGNYCFNEQGWNSLRNYDPLKHQGVLRVAVVGDSYVEALQVNTKDAFFSVAERHMNRAARPAEWYAFGTSGWGTTQELGAIRHYALDYHPDVVVILFVQNDPDDSSPFIAQIEPYMLTYTLTDAEKLVVKPPTFWRPSFLKRLAAKSALVRYLKLQRRRDNTVAPLREGAPPVISGDLAERQRKTWLLVEKTLATARDEVRGHGARLLVAYRGDVAAIESPLREPKPLPRRDSDPFALDARADRMGEEILAPMMNRLGIPYLDLTAALRARVAESRQSHYFPGDGHWNTMAHETAGLALADFIEGLATP